MVKKSLALVLALTLLVVGIAAGTLAWLTAKSDTVTNTFTISGITVKLQETTGTTYKMVPGYEIGKNPKAWVVSDSEDCFLFVKLEKSENFDEYLEYAVADGWTLVPGETDVYCRTVTSAQMSADNGATNAYQVLKDDKVTVKGEVTKEMMESLTENTYPTLKITAYASQLHKNADEDFGAAEAWANVNPANP